jgi:hypothetical protein
MSAVHPGAGAWFTLAAGTLWPEQVAPVSAVAELKNHRLQNSVPTRCKHDAVDASAIPPARMAPNPQFHSLLPGIGWGHVGAWSHPFAPNSHIVELPGMTSALNEDGSPARQWWPPHLAAKHVAQADKAPAGENAFEAGALRTS